MLKLTARICAEKREATGKREPQYISIWSIGWGWSESNFQSLVTPNRLKCLNAAIATKEKTVIYYSMQKVLFSC